jgi:hypothetical protein
LNSRRAALKLDKNTKFLKVSVWLYYGADKYQQCVYNWVSVDLRFLGTDFMSPLRILNYRPPLSIGKSCGENSK